MSPQRLLVAVAAAHLAVGLVCLAWLMLRASPVLGVHPALKPMKFGFSIAAFLGTMALLVPMLQVGAGTRRVVAWTLAGTMAVEMAPILLQALRGTTSHFNTRAPLDARTNVQLATSTWAAIAALTGRPAW